MPNEHAQQVQLWDKARDVITILLIPAVVWLNTQTQRNAETTYALTAAKSQISENRSHITELRRDYNALNIQIVELKATLRAIQETLGGLKAQMESIEDRVREIDAKVQQVQGAVQFISTSPSRPKSTPWLNSQLPLPSSGSTSGVPKNPGIFLGPGTTSSTPSVPFTP